MSDAALLPGERERWLRGRALELSPADAVECGWPKASAERCFERLFAGRSAVSESEAGALLDDPAELAKRLRAAPGQADIDPEACARIVREMLDYRRERAEVARRYHAIRHTRANLKKLVPRDIGVDVVRALARDLGWRIREDEEGVTVPVADLLPYFRRPVVRALLEGKRAQAGVA